MANFAKLHQIHLLQCLFHLNFMNAFARSVLGSVLRAGHYRLTLIIRLDLMLNTQISDSGWQPIIFHSAQGHCEIGWYPDISAGHLSAGIRSTLCVWAVWYVSIIPFLKVRNIWPVYAYVSKEVIINMQTGFILRYIKLYFIHKCSGNCFTIVHSHNK